VSDGEFFAELRQLRSDLGPVQQMRTVCRPKTLTSAVSLISALAESEPYVRFALYPSSAKSGDRPVVEVDANIDNHVSEIQEGELVEVAGTVGVGHAIVVIVGDRRYWPRGPASLSLRPPRL
jgi:hypothetical protein